MARGRRVCCWMLIIRQPPPTAVGRGTVTALVRSAISSRTFTQQGYADRDLVTFTASAGIISATLAVVPPVRQSWGLFPALPDPWYRSKLNWGLEVLDANGTRVAGPVSNAWQGTAAIRFNAGDAGRGSNYFVRVSPLAVPGQPGLYGVQGAYALNVSYQAPTVPCPTTGLPICVDEQSGARHWHVGSAFAARACFRPDTAGPHHQPLPAPIADAPLRPIVPRRHARAAARAVRDDRLAVLPRARRHHGHVQVHLQALRLRVPPGGRAVRQARLLLRLWRRLHGGPDPPERLRLPQRHRRRLRRRGAVRW